MRPAARRRRSGGRERGFVAVWFAMLLVVLLGICALAVDIVHAYQVKERAQNAADAAALGGTVFLPGNPVEAASRAQALAKNNGFQNGSGGVTVTAAQQTNPTQLKVTVSKVVSTWFAKAIGFSAVTVHADSTADYDQPVAMGSPANTFGNTVDCSGSCSTGSQYTDFWANVEGPDTPKINGNAYTARWCSGGQTDNCSPLNSFSNSEYSSSGYYYVVKNGTAGASLRFDVFDAPFVSVGNHCDDANLNNLHNIFPVGSADWRRYKPGDWHAPPNADNVARSEFCTGDSFLSGAAGNTPATTVFRVLQPDSTPWTDADNPAEPQCGTQTVSGFNNAVDAYNNVTARARFRKWWSICTVSGAQAGDYILQVRTTAGQGNNNFSLRACTGSCGSSNVSIFGRSRMAIFANSTGTNNTTFYLARVAPGAAGRALNVDFYDVGDAPGGSSGTLRVIPPPDATVNGSPLTAFGQLSGNGDNCRYTAPPGSSTGPPWGSYSYTSSTCSVSGVSSTSYNGQWVQWQVPIPAGYSCDYASATGCWLRISFGFSGGVNDVTTWKASLSGNPVRLVD